MEAISKGSTVLHNSTFLFSNTNEGNLDKVIQLYKDDKILVRTLYSTFHESRFENLRWELDELIHCSVRKSSSASYLPYKIPMYPLGRIGLILNLDKCLLECMYSEDAGVSRVDSKNRFISWNKPLKVHTLILDGKNNIPISGSEIEHKAMGLHYKVDKIKDIKNYMENLSLTRKPVNHNEVVVSYTADSIVGVAAIINNIQDRRYPSNEQILIDSETFKSILWKEVQLDLPVFVYDCQSAELTLNT